MNRVLVFCWREWRAQRGVLLAYLGLVFAASGLGLSLVPESWWEQDGNRALALSWFVAAGVLGVLLFAAPGLVRTEFAGNGGGKGDQFVRRLPGALLPSFGGKLLFLAFASLALPVTGLAVGEAWLTLLGRSWDDLFVHQFAAGGGYDVVTEWPWTATAIGCAALLIPWVWAVGTWLPAGRMAVGCVVLLVLSLGLGVTAVLRQCPDLEKWIAWQSWLWFVAPLGAVVASLSWVRGRRGGGALRSARVGVAALLVGLAPPVVWFGAAAHHYHHPDPHQLTDIDAVGVSPDLRFALVRGREQGTGSVPFRVELATGVPQRIGGVQCWATPATVGRQWSGQGVGVSWQVIEGERHSVFDLATGVSTAVDAVDERGSLVLPPELHATVVEQQFAQTQWRAPGDRRFAVVGDEILVERADGSRLRRPWPREHGGLLRAAGHGIESWSGDRAWFDCEGREVVLTNGDPWSTAIAVRDRWLFVPKWRSGPRCVWHQREPDGSSSPCDALRDAAVLGLVDDDRVLACATATDVRAPRLFCYQPADRTVTELSVPKGIAFQSVQAEFPVAGLGSLLPRDGSGRVWLECSNTGAMRRLQRGERDATLLVDVATGAVTVLTWQPASWHRLLGWPDAESVLLCEGRAIDRVDIATGARTRLFPR